MITDKQHELLKDIIGNTERPDKINVRLDPVSRTMVIEYEDMDDEWFMEMLESPNIADNRTASTETTEGG